jgi:hypothetical protein
MKTTSETVCYNVTSPSEALTLCGILIGSLKTKYGFWVGVHTPCGQVIVLPVSGVVTILIEPPLS